MTTTFLTTINAEQITAISEHGFDHGRTINDRTVYNMQTQAQQAQAQR